MAQEPSTPGNPNSEDNLIEAARRQELGERDGKRGPLDPTAAPLAPLPERVGSYRILARLGEGGMGIVYEAEQAHPRRPVALKVVRGGPHLSDQDLRLFLREMQVLARLRHAGIATIYEAGRTAEGQHFFAMELVRGMPLTAFARQFDLDIPQRLALFRKVCEAVTYAHQRGVIHRDLKPSNILVEADGNPKVLDFGLARITDADLQLSMLATAAGRIRGTLPYMSPEQIRGNADAIDVRSDVYALGVILYELLTERLPCDPSGLSLPEAARRICEQPPRRPSILRRALRGDVETIILMAMDKDPQRRYASAAALSDDLERHLTCQPIVGRPPSAFYQLRKLAARHKLTFAMAAALLAVTVGLGAAAGILYRRAERLREEAEVKAQLASDEARRAASERERAQQVVKLLVNLFEVADPERAQGTEVSAREVLEAAIPRLHSELADQPAVLADLLDLIGQILDKLGQHARAADLLEEAGDVQARVPDGTSSRRAEILGHLAEAQAAMGRFEDARQNFTEALTTCRADTGRDVSMERSLLTGLADMAFSRGEFDVAASLLDEALDRAPSPSLQTPDATLARTTSGRAVLLFHHGHYQQAERLLREALRLYSQGSNSPSIDELNCRRELAYFLVKTGREDEGDSLCREVLADARHLLGDEHPVVVGALNVRAIASMQKGEHDRAIDSWREAIAITERQQGSTDPSLGLYYVGMAMALRKKGDLVQATQTCRHALAIQRLTNPQHPRVSSCLVQLGEILLDAGHPDEAERALREAHAIRQAVVLPEGKWTAAETGSLLAESVLLQGLFEEGEQLLLDALKLLNTTPNETPEGQLREDKQRVHYATLCRLLVLYERYDAGWRTRGWEISTP